MTGALRTPAGRAFHRRGREWDDGFVVVPDIRYARSGDVAIA
jgi:hypothetical protein